MSRRTGCTCSTTNSRRGERGRGLGRALGAAARGELHALGFTEATTEVDETNTASQALPRRFVARRIGGLAELVGRGAP